MYEQVSRDDELQGESCSISHQKQMLEEVEKVVCKIYEDNALGKLPDARYAALDTQYAKEQDALNVEITNLQTAISDYEQTRKFGEQFIALVDQYENFDTLIITMLNEFIEKIIVHERDRKGSQDTTQEEIRKRKERKDRLHQNHLRRKASGAQKQYEDKIKAEKKAAMEAKNTAICAEDMAKGVLIPVSQMPRQEPQRAAL